MAVIDKMRRALRCIARPSLTATALAVVAGLCLTAAANSKEICWTQGATQFVDATHYCVSSVLPPQGRWSYGPKNLADGDYHTAWCEGVKGAGIGETITIRIDGGPPFRRLSVSNGYGKSRKSYQENGRIKTVEITADTGISTTVNLIDQNGELPVYLPGLAQRWVRLKIIDVYLGTRFSDTCVDIVSPDFVYEEELLQQQQVQQPSAAPPTATPTSPPPEPAPMLEEPASRDGEELEELPELPGRDASLDGDSAVGVCLTSGMAVTGRVEIHRATHPSGYKMESYHLVTPQLVCVIADSERIEAARRIQLAPDSESEATKLDSRLGFELTVRGTFVVPHTAWHTGDALLVNLNLE